MSVSIYAGNFNKDNNVKETSINYKENVSNRLMVSMGYLMVLLCQRDRITAGWQITHMSRY